MALWMIELILTIGAFGHNQRIFEQSNLTSLEIYVESVIQQVRDGNVDLIADSKNTNKEAENDQYQQRNQQLQTNILTVAMFYTAALTLVIQAPLPEGTPSEIITLMSIFGALSFVNILICIALSIELLHRTSEFMIRRASHYTNVVNIAEAALTNFDSQLENGIEMFGPGLNENDRTFMSSFFDFFNNETSPNVRISEAIAFLKRNLREQRAIKHNLLQNTNHYTFEQFWKKNCVPQKMWGDYFCYAGLFCTIIASGIWVFNYYTIVHKNRTAACIFVAILSLSSVAIPIIYKNRMNTINDEIHFNENLPTQLIPVHNAEDMV